MARSVKSSTWAPGAPAQSGWFTEKLFRSPQSFTALLSFGTAPACKAMNEGQRQDQRDIFSAAGKKSGAGHAHECSKAHLLHRGVGEAALPFMGW